MPHLYHQFPPNVYRFRYEIYHSNLLQQVTVPWSQVADYAEEACGELTAKQRLQIKTHVRSFRSNNKGSIKANCFATLHTTCLKHHMGSDQMGGTTFQYLDYLASQQYSTPADYFNAYFNGNLDMLICVFHEMSATDDWALALFTTPRMLRNDFFNCSPELEANAFSRGQDETHGLLHVKSVSGFSFSTYGLSFCCPPCYCCPPNLLVPNCLPNLPMHVN